MKLKFKNILSFLKNSVLAILKGEFLLRLNVSKYFVHIIYTFFLFAVIIWTSLMTDNAMAEVQKNNRTIEELRIANSQKTFELVEISKRSEVRERLRKMKSPVHENQTPAYRLEK